MSNLAQNTINAKINVSIFFVGCSINAHVEHSKLLLGHPNTLQLDSLDVVVVMSNVDSLDSNVQSSAKHY